MQFLCSPIRNFISVCRIGSETIHADENDFSVMLSYYACCVTRESEFVYSHEAGTYYEPHDILRIAGLHYWPLLWRGKGALLT